MGERERPWQSGSGPGGGMAGHPRARPLPDNPAPMTACATDDDDDDDNDFSATDNAIIHPCQDPGDPSASSWPCRRDDGLTGSPRPDRGYSWHLSAGLCLAVGIGFLEQGPQAVQWCVGRDAVAGGEQKPPIGPIDGVSLEFFLGAFRPATGRAQRSSQLQWSTMLPGGTGLLR